MSFSEEVHRFGLDDGLVGVLALPDGAAPHRRGVIFLNAGVLHRVGPNRVHVKSARRLAAAGVPSLRFDFSGIGDSAVSADRSAFDDRSFNEVQAAIDLLRSQGRVEEVVLAGICSGAMAAMKAATREPRIVGAVLINPQFDEGSEEAAGAPSDERIPTELLADAVLAHFDELIRGGTKLLLVLSSPEAELDELSKILSDNLADLRRSGKLDCEIVSHSDHLFTSSGNQQKLLDALSGWVSPHDTQ